MKETKSSTTSEQMKDGVGIGPPPKKLFKSPPIYPGKITPLSKALPDPHFHITFLIMYIQHILSRFPQMQLAVILYCSLKVWGVFLSDDPG